MIVPRHREIACAILIDREGRFLLQRRDNVPGILYPGKIGLFGGHREGDETFLQCVVREVHEETGYRGPPERYEHLWSYTGAEFEGDGGTLNGEYYVLRDVPFEAIRVTEGSLVVASQADLPSLTQQFAPSAMAAFEMLFRK
jgi:8-oxo-dGTP diphosphatase